MGELKEELRRMGVEVNHGMLSWKGPNGLSGDVKGGIKLFPGDWICQKCEVVIFCKRGVRDCFKCGGKRPDSDDGRGRGRNQSSDWGADRRNDDWGGGADRNRGADRRSDDWGRGADRNQGADRRSYDRGRSTR